MAIRAYCCRRTPPSTDALHIISQLARLSKDYYPALHKLQPYSALAALLTAERPEIRAKTCNVLGNMMRHSDFFYGALEQYGLLSRLVPLCKDQSGTCRKFASFAVGNAAFHSALLYAHLAPAIGPLVDLLSDQDEKTRANAAGALGNLVRNSSELCARMISAGALDGLLNLVERGSADLDDSSVKIALFSLGNLSVHAPCRDELHRLPTKRLCDRLTSSLPPEHMAAKYAQRLLQKLA